MPGLWRNQEGTREGKYLVLRRDGTMPEWPYFVLGARDPAAPHAIREYAYACRDRGMDEQYCHDLLNLAEEFAAFRRVHGTGDPDAAPHREDDPEVIAKMQGDTDDRTPGKSD